MECFESSIFLRYVGQGYLAIEEKLSSVYLSSFTHQLIAKIAELIKIGFRYSIFGRLTEINVDASRNFLETSKTTNIALNGIRSLRDKLITSSATSSLGTSIRSLKCDFFSRPLKFGGITIITAIMINVVLLIILQKHISLWDWFMRALLLFIGISGLFCNADWLTIRNYSLILRKTSSRVK